MKKEIKKLQNYLKKCIETGTFKVLGYKAHRIEIEIDGLILTFSEILGTGLFIDSILQGVEIDCTFIQGLKNQEIKQQKLAQLELLKLEIEKL